MQTEQAQYYIEAHTVTTPNLDFNSNINSFNKLFQ